eukprot:4439807-Karenia_brevis.AAC.1
MQSLQNQVQTSNVSSSSVSQWFDMEAPGGVGVAEKPRVPTLELPKPQVDTSSKEQPPAPSGGAAGGGGGNDPNTKSKEADKITLEPLPTVP